MSEKSVHLVGIGDSVNHGLANGERIFMGSAYGFAVGASLFAERGNVGIVTRIGDDLDYDPYETLRNDGIDTTGVSVVKGGKTALLTIDEDPKSHAWSFTVEDYGVAGQVDTASFPQSYLHAKHIHLATFHPERQLEWIAYLKSPDRFPGNPPTISVDLFLPFVEKFPAKSHAVASSADLVFINQDENRAMPETLIFSRISAGRPMIVKTGRGGAYYVHDQGAKFLGIHVPATKVNVVDTTGAGEVLAGVYLAQRIRDIDRRIALRDAASVASQVVTNYGIDHVRTLPRTNTVFKNNDI